MLFNSLEYFLFFVAVLLVAWLTTGFGRLRIWFLLLASLYFYASNNTWQTLILLFTTTIDYWICLRLAKTDDERKRKHLVLISIVSNLGLLAYFKYVNFFGNGVAALAQSFGIELSWVTLNVMLPIGISFYTFEALSYTIDVYRRKIPAEPEWNRLAFLVTFFPHLIAGPIIRAADFFPQIGQKFHLTRREMELAFFLIGCGLIKKIVFADTLAPYADAAFTNPADVGTLRAWLGVYAFAFQIYFDFSGYTDIAIGSAKLLGFQLPENFARPYVAHNITDFWRRWHISLSTWLRDYLYIPLGGNRMKTKLGVYRNLMLTMLLGGLWHGAAWTFICWGALHGAYLSFERAIGLKNFSTSGLRHFLAALLTFHVVAFTWIPFRAHGMDDVLTMFRTMFTNVSGPEITYGALVAFAIILGAWSWQFITERFDIFSYWAKKSLAFKTLFYTVVAVLVLIIGSDVPKSFIYFQF